MRPERASVPLTIDRFLTPQELEKSLRTDVIEGLTGTPKTLPPKWFYDEAGSSLFEEITRLPEYYPTRREHAILTARAHDIAELTAAVTLLELGAGSAEKTGILLDALSRNGTLHSYIPVDVSGDFLVEVAERVARDRPALAVHAVVADYERHLHLVPAGRRRLFVFLGSTVGNMTPPQRAEFFGGLKAVMAPDDWLLLGTDLVKDAGRLVQAYDDASGVTAAFNRNVLSVINRHLDGDFQPEMYRHVAVWNPAHEWIEMRLRAVGDQKVRLEAIGLELHLADGEEIRTEVSAKFRRAGLEAELESAGLAPARWWTDPDGDYALCLSRPAATTASRTRVSQFSGTQRRSSRQ